MKWALFASFMAVAIAVIFAIPGEDVMYTTTQHDPVSESLLSLGKHSVPDYVDQFSVFASEIRGGSPEHWARALVEDSAGAGGQVLWRRVLGLRLKRSPDRVGGWAISDQGDDWIRLEAASWLPHAEIVVQVEKGRLSVGTFIRYESPIASVYWPPLAILHRRAMPGLLRNAVRAYKAKAR